MRENKNRNFFVAFSLGARHICAVNLSFFDPPDVLTADEARQLFAPHFPALLDCVQGAWKAWKDYYAGRAHALDASARASIVACEMLDLAKRHFAAHAKASLHKVRGAHFLLFDQDDEQAAARFKKFGKDGRTRNIRTRQQERIEFQLPLPGIPRMSYVNVGYELDRLQHELVGVYMTLEFSGQILWKLDLSVEAGSLAEVTDFSLSARSWASQQEPASQQQTAEQELARPRGKGAKKETENQSSE